MNEDSSIFSKEEISSYLSEVKKAIRDKKYTFPRREKNKKLFIDYIIDEKKRLEIIYNLTVDDFCYVRNNDHKNYSNEKLYVFSKKIKLIKRFDFDEQLVGIYIKFNKLEDGFCFIISFHELEHPINKYFK